jgi:uridine kinase
MTAQTIEKIVKRDGRVVPFNKDKITFAVLQAAVAVGGRDRTTAERIADKVLLQLQQRHAPGSYPTVEEVQDMVEKELIEEGHAKTAKAFIVYRYEHALKREGKRSLTYSSDNIPYKKLWKALSWAVDKNCYDLAGIRNFVESGRFPELVAASEQFYTSELEEAKTAAAEKLPDIRLMIIAGPSSSGKTTTTIKISEVLRAKGRSIVPLNVDNYFFDLETHPKNISGDYDYETPQALDLELLNEHLKNLIDGKKVRLPFYNFKTGKRESGGKEIELKKNDILLMDCLHGLYEPMTAAVPEEKKFKVYIETLAQVKDDSGRFIRWSDIRMLRRMVRDMQFRNYSPRQTLLHWNLVRRSELRYIIARINASDVIVNSFMPCELPIFNYRLGGFFSEIIPELEGTVEYEDALGRALRTKALLDAVPLYNGEKEIPADSLLREFIGGSVYSY